MRGRGDMCDREGMCCSEACLAGAGMHGRVHAWQGRMCGRGHAWQRGMHGRRDSHCSGWYAFYWNAFLLKDIYESFSNIHQNINEGWHHDANNKFCWNQWQSPFFFSNVAFWNSLKLKIWNTVLVSIISTIALEFTTVNLIANAQAWLFIFYNEHMVMTSML